VDGSFMRFWYDCEDTPQKQRLSSTIFFFLLAVNGVLLVLSVIAAPFLSEWLLGASGFTLALQLVLLNTFAIGFTFIPLHVMRIEDRSRQFSAFTFARSAATLLLRVLLVVGAGLGVMGVVIADVVVTAVLMVVMLRWFAPLIRPVVSRALLRDVLAFGLPRVPHGFALQVMSVGDRFMLSFLKVPLDLIGTYSIAVGFGLIPKLALGAFEYAWQPFYYATSREPGAPKVFSTVTTYGVAVLALLVAGLAAIARDLLDIVTHGQYVGAEAVVSWTALGVFFYGIYLLTSIGLNITKNTKYYPVSTAIGAGVNIGLNLALIPRFGILGAAWANAVTYAVQAGIAYRLSQRFYPVDYEAGRLLRAVVAALAAYAAAASLPEMSAWPSLLARGTTVVVVMGVILAVTRFFNVEELRALNSLRTRNRGLQPVAPPPDTTEMAGEIVGTDVQDQSVDK
jgi:O-antigen/teichoic acid export membrane protein